MIQQLQSPPENATLTIRKATREDISFIARIDYEASLPPMNHCFWDDLLEGTGTKTIDFLEAIFQLDASAWGSVEDFLILLENDQPVAAAAGYQPNQEDYRPLHLSHLEKVGKFLGWSDKTTVEFREGYEQLFGPEPRDIVFKPQATWIIETVAVIPEARGRGLGKVLVKSLIDKGRSEGHTHAGIMIINGNERARRTYESLGFKLYISFGAEYFDDKFPGLIKFRQRLN